MPQLLSLTRAARLTGVARGTLQKRIRNGELPTFEGMVRVSDVLRLYPDTDLDKDTELERVRGIKAEAFAKRVVQHVLPDAEVLFARVEQLGRELAGSKKTVGQYHALVTALQQRLRRDSARSAQAQGLLAPVLSWLEASLQEMAADTAESQSLWVRDSLLRVMTAHVRLRPSERDFFVEGAESILQAALNAGLALPYGCTDGSCGQCKARILSGHIKRSMDAPYALSEDEQIRGYALLCANTAVTDLLIEVEEIAAPQTIAPQTLDAQVYGVEFPTPKMMVLNLKSTPAQRLHFLAGQSAELCLADGQCATYPIASCPCNEQVLQFHIGLTEDSAFAHTAHAELRPGMGVQVRGPQGAFTLRNGADEPLLFIVVGHHFAAMQSLIEHAIALNTAEHIHLVWLALHTDDIYRHNLCRSWTDALDNFTYVAFNAGAVGATGEPAREAVMDRIFAYLQEQVEDLPDYQVYIAGPSGYSEAIQARLEAGGVTPARIKQAQTGAVA